jgi:hypothetical protein
MLSLAKNILGPDVKQQSKNGKWVPVLPENEKLPYKTLYLRFRDAIAVFKCKAVPVKWDIE